MKTQTYPAAFWNWFFLNRYQDYQYLKENQTIISGAENPCSDPPTYDMEISFEEQLCRDPDDIEIDIIDYIAFLEDKETSAVQMLVEMEFLRWNMEIEEEKENQPFLRDLVNYQWKMKRGEDLKVATTFDIQLDSVIEKFNINRQEWDRTFQGQIRGLKSGKLICKPFKFEPLETHTVKNFSEAVWEKDFFQVKITRNEEIRQFWTFLDTYYSPRIIREYTHYGFIEFRDEMFFLSGNVLVRFPKEQDGRLQLISKKDDAFNVDENIFLRPPEDAFHLPRYELGIPDPVINRYREAESVLFNDSVFEKQLKEVEQHLCAMIGGEHDFRHWGQLILGYVFCFLFFDEIYELYQHGIYLYLYGEGNVGKGELAKRILDFFGISYLDSLNNPPARTVDQELELKSKIPLWIDEFVPEISGKKDKIDDQVWNSWFELKIRQTNIQDKKSSWKKERKNIRTIPLFCSNFKPQTDHLLSRCLILEYRKAVRGPERHVRWLKQNKKLLQLLMLSFMQHYHTLDRNAFCWNLDLVRTTLRDQVKHELEGRIQDVILQDRQTTQFAILFTVYHWLFADYREKITEMYAKKRNLMSEENISFKNEQMEAVKIQILGLTDDRLYQFVKEQIIKSAVSAASHDPLTEYIESIGALIQRGKITEQHFNWMKDGTLKIYARGVWDIYESEKRGTDSMVRKDMVENKLKEFSKLSPDGQLKTVSWTVPGSVPGLNGEKVTQRGFYIPDAVQKEQLRRAFNWEKYRPSTAPSYKKLDTAPELTDFPF